MMIRTRLRKDALDIEDSFCVAQLVIDGYSSGDVQLGQLAGLVMRSGDGGAVSFVLGAIDGYLDQVMAGDVTLRGFTNIRNDVDIDQDLRVNVLDDGQSVGWLSLTTVEAIGTSQQQVTSLAVPAGAQVAAVSSRILTQPPGTSSMQVGVAGSALSLRRYASGASTSAGSSDRGADTPGQFYRTGISVVLTFDTAPSSSGGSIRLTLHYKLVSAPTS